MHDLYELKEKLMRNLEDYSKKEMTASNLEIVDKLSHTIKNLCKIIEDAEESEYSERGGSYARNRYSRERNGGRYSRARRDSLGRYSSHDGMIGELRDLMDEAPDEKTRMEFDRFIKKMETMG